MTKVHSAIALAFVAVSTVAGCSGTMQGAVRGTGEPVQVSYEQGMDSDTLTAVVSGETFRGKAVMDGATATVATAFGTAYSGGTSAFGNSMIVGSTSTSNFVAVLLGDKGSSLSCQLRYADAMGMTSSGGVGVCQHSDGRVIDLVW